MSRRVKAVSMARSEYRRCPPRLPPRRGVQAAIASGANHTVTSPRRTRARLYADQFATRYFVLYVGWTFDCIPVVWPPWTDPRRPGHAAPHLQGLHATTPIVGFGVHAGVVDGRALCGMFNRAIRAHAAPKYLSADHDPLYRFHQWRANLRVLRVTEVKSVPYVPMSHPFVERLIGTLRRECLDRTLFWSAPHLEQKLADFQDFYNAHRAHASLQGRTPVPTPKNVATLHRYRWEAHCRGLYQTPIAA